RPVHRLKCVRQASQALSSLPGTPEQRRGLRRVCCRHQSSPLTLCGAFCGREYGVSLQGMQENAAGRFGPIKNHRSRPQHWIAEEQNRIMYDNIVWEAAVTL